MKILGLPTWHGIPSMNPSKARIHIRAIIATLAVRTIRTIIACFSHCNLFPSKIASKSSQNYQAKIKSKPGQEKIQPILAQAAARAVWRIFVVKGLAAWLVWFCTGVGVGGRGLVAGPASPLRPIYIYIYIHIYI